jgi:fructokinase
MGHKLGIDLGGTKTEVVVLDPEGQTVYRQRVTTPADSYDAILDLISRLVRAAETELGLHVSVGIGIPGAISPRAGLLRNSNTVCMNGRPFASDLEASLEREVRIENDANCFALSEARGGAGRGHPTVFGVIIGTGTGGGLVIDGKLVNGPHAISGEWGHNPLPWQRSIDGSPSCYCGKSACIETFLSGPGLEHNYRLRFGESRSSHEIIAGASAGDDACEAMMALYHDQMARSLAQLINILDPHAIVLGGGMSNIDSIYEEVPKLLPAYVFSDFVETPLLAAARGDASGVYGAALLWQ